MPRNVTARTGASRVPGEAIRPFVASRVTIRPPRPHPGYRQLMAVPFFRLRAHDVTGPARPGACRRLSTMKESPCERSS
ncbi:hypothetical protein HNR16_000528 [Pseudoclavibacter chungangensis]|nr:hypothetical protein [Pseudoclavibacter chungangensis]